MKAKVPADRPWLTVVMPSHHGERWIDTALRSIVAQGHEGVELVLIDSGVTAAVRDIAQTYSKRLRIRVFERRDLRSWQAKSNFGVQMAETEHISWLGVDDVWLPGRTMATKAWINAAPESPLHFAPCEIIGDDGRRLGVWRCPLPQECPLQPLFVTERLLIQNFVAAPAPVFRRDAWLRCGGLDENLWYTADWDMWLKLATCAPTYYHSDVTIGFRSHSDSLTATGSRDTADFYRQMQTVLARHLPTLTKSSESLEHVARASIGVNMALASASAGHFRALPQAAFRVARLGPAGMRRYFRDSRIAERLMPRLRAKLTGSFMTKAIAHRGVTQ
jgi:glycosyltransferase involved in cell wall biosynthesis